MEFLKKNYEKVILSLVLLGLAVAAVQLLFRVSKEQSRLQEIENMDVTMPKKDYVPANQSTNEAALRRLRRPGDLKLAGEHNIFNPVTWQRRPDGSLIKIVTGDEVGPGALRITAIRPLYLIVTYEGTGVLGSDVLHKFKVTREAARNPRQRAPQTIQVTSVGTKTELFTLKDMKPPEAPTEFTLEMTQDKTQVVLTRDQPYQGVAGYTVDLKYEPERQTFLGKRLDDRLVFAGDTNKIVAITASSVTVEALSNNKRTTIEAETSGGVSR